MQIFFFILIFLLSFQAKADSINLGVKIRFDSGISTINYNDDLLVADELISLKNLYPQSRFLIAGHTDSLGTDSVNQVLSVARAQSLERALLQRGFQENHSETKGYSESAPISDNKTKAGRAKNRRAVVTIYNLTPNDLQRITEIINNSNRLFIISIENKIVEKDITLKEELAPSPQTHQTSALPPEAKKNAEKQLLHRYKLGIGTTQSFLEADNISGATSEVHAKWVSENNYNFSGSYQLNLKKHFWLGLHAGVDFQSYEDQTNTSFVWDRKDPTLSNTSIVFDYEKNRLGLGANLGVQQHAFITNDTGNIVSLGKEYITTLTTKFNYLLFKTSKKSSTIGIELLFPLVSSGDLNIKNTVSGGLLKYTIASSFLKSHQLHLKLFYSYLNFEYSTEQSSQTVGAQLSLRSKNWL